MIKRSCAYALMAALVLGSVPAAAHHSYAMFDLSTTTSTGAVVSTWEFTNPHGKLWVYINDSTGKPKLWALEAPGPAQLLKHGWDKYTVKPGDKVKVSFHPLRGGDQGGSLLKITLTDGREFDAGGPPGNGGFNDKPPAAGK
jgi:hypothetical protein